MTTTKAQAKDDMFSLVTKANNEQTVIGYVPEIRYQDVEKSTKPPSDKFWMRVLINTVVSEQRALAICVTGPDKRLYEEAGLIRLELFIPKTNGAITKADQWAQVLRNAFRGVKTPNKVWFRNSVIKELDPEGEFFRLNVISEFNYSEVY